jgi:hypothetical protein
MKHPYLIKPQFSYAHKECIFFISSFPAHLLTLLIRNNINFITFILHVAGVVLETDLFPDPQVAHFLVLCFLRTWMGTQRRVKVSILTTEKSTNSFYKTDMQSK